ncbi:serine/threonine protein kinase [Paenibacillus sp. DMB20]|uniref:serine/threonine protein kinase n=1 Tax=Paenibacillus sp. DMB20 TaxID=1642570 RepID=UPI000627DEB1|nr:serine/threonine protein kinase [Paenibacillus sp. DMB20]KKO55143.1 serine/threonine protein kinase [Paenibacillus sp. DMB20]
MTTLSDPGYPPGTVITGKWRKGRYIVERMLGKGANGRVYLVQRPGRSERYALKIGFDALDLQSEINVLSTLKEQMPDHYLVEADDHQDGSGDVPFYVMRYVEGTQLQRFIRARGREWLGLVGLKLLERLVALHGSGYVFGDLKPENVMVSAYGRVELIDYGGVSAIGRSVKQFTEWYDRGYWNAGSRTGDEAYDLFSFAVMCIQLLDEQSLRAASAQLPQIRSVADLQTVLRKNPQLKPYSGWLSKALAGGFANSREALNVWKHTVYAPPRAKGREKTPRWLKRSFVLSIVVLGAAVYLFLTT